MEVDEGGESEVVAVEEGQRSGRRKRAPSSPPKQSRKRARAATATQTTTGSQVRTESTGSVGIGCERCVRQGIACVAVDGGARCANCKAKHYGCSLVVGKEVPRGKGGPSGSQQAKAAAGSQTSGKARRGKGAKGAALGGLTSGECVLLSRIRVLKYYSDPGQHEVVKRIKSASAAGELFHTREGLHHGIDALRCRLESYNVELWSIIRERAMCEESVRQLEEALEAEPSTDEEEELARERARDEAKRRLAARQRGRVEASEEEKEEEEEEEEDELEGSSGLSARARARGKRPAK